MRKSHCSCTRKNIFFFNADSFINNLELYFSRGYILSFSILDSLKRFLIYSLFSSLSPSHRINLHYKENCLIISFWHLFELFHTNNDNAYYYESWHSLRWHFAFSYKQNGIYKIRVNLISKMKIPIYYLVMHLFSWFMRYHKILFFNSLLNQFHANFL